MAHVGVATHEEIKARMLRIARGEHKPAAGDPKRWYVPSAAAARIECLERALFAMFDAYEGVYDRTGPPQYQSDAAKHAEGLARDALADLSKSGSSEEARQRRLLSPWRRLWLKGYQAGWDRAHEPAACGHARANWKDPKWGTPGYRGEERCEFCDALATQQP